MRALTAFEIPDLGALPVPVNHWGEPIQRFEFSALLRQKVLLRGLQAYAWYRLRPGGFLCACLANDFSEAVAYADFQSQFLLAQIGAYITNHMPSDCHGSPEAIERWIAAGEAAAAASAGFDAARELGAQH